MCNEIVVHWSWSRMDLNFWRTKKARIHILGLSTLKLTIKQTKSLKFQWQGKSAIYMLSVKTKSLMLCFRSLFFLPAMRSVLLLLKWTQLLTNRKPTFMINTGTSVAGSYGIMSILSQDFQWRLNKSSVLQTAYCSWNKIITPVAYSIMPWSFKCYLWNY